MMARDSLILNGKLSTILIHVQYMKYRAESCKLDA